MSKENMSKVEKLYMSVMGINEDFDRNGLMTITALELQSMSEEEAKTADDVLKEILRHNNEIQKLLRKR